MSTIEEDVLLKRSRRKSEVWKYYEDSPDSERAICKACGKSLSAKSKTGTSHLKRHIETCQNFLERGMNQSPFIDWQEEISMCNIIEDPESGDQSISNKRPKKSDLESGDRSISNKRPKKSDVWDHFQKTPDHLRAICEYCGQSYSSTKASGTSHLKRHLERCEKRPMGDIKQPLSVAFQDEYRDFGLNQEQKNEEPHLKMAIMAEIPLLSSNCKRVWRSLMGPINLEREVCDYYQNEKMKLAVQLKNLTSRVTFTCEMTGEVEGYISITAYFINDDNYLVKRLIGFKKLCDSGLVAAIETCLSDWKLEDKLFTFTLDSGLDQSEVIDSLRSKYSSRMLFDGQYIHVPCCKTILVEFIDHYFYSFVLEEGRKIREFFDTLTNIPSRMSTFNKLAMEMGFPPVDVIWLKKYSEDLDSVVLLLKDVILYKDVFSRYILTEIGQWHFTPCSINWKRVELALQIIGPIIDIVNEWSSCHYPRPNLYFQSLLEIRTVISSLEKDISEVEIVRESEAGEKNVSSLKDSIADQLGTCNELLFIACILDPRFKLIYLEYCFGKIFESNQGKVRIYRIRECLRMFFEEYAQEKANESSSLPSETTNIKQEGSSSEYTLCRTKIINEFSMYKKQCKKNMKESELDEYLSEDVVDVTDADFNLLGWWKQNRSRYPVLARIARDILAVPNLRSNISAEKEANPRLVEAVMCSKAWIISDVQSDVPGEQSR
ncbi:zinc finger BED domain-containing protein RICESLEEPER 1-like [Carex rostrata]